MKNIFRTTALLLVIIGILNSCSKDIDLPIPSTTPRLVMNGVMEPDSLFILNLSGSISAKSGNLPSYINDGEVSIYENGVLKSTMKYYPGLRSNPWSTTPIEGDYIDTSFNPETGHTYTIRASRTGFTSIEAEVRVPIINQIDTLSVRNVVLTTGGGFGGGQSSQGKSVELKIKDLDKSAKNYYLIKVSMVDSFGNGGGINGIGTNNLNLQDLNGLQGSTESSDKLYLTDDLFSNNSFIAELHFEIWNGGPWGGGGVGTYFLDVISISKEYYQYLQSQDAYMNSNGNPFAEPAQITSNVKNGYGIIGGQIVKRFRLP